jgi:hypothetical protein
VTNLNIPNFGELLAPYIGQVPAQAVPNFLALLERGAASRYREWSDMMPEQREGLLACAGREDQIADHADALFPLDPALKDEVDAPLPAARDTYYAVFTGLAVEDQLRIQANAERQGAAAWRAMVSKDNPEAMNATLEAMSALEETSADFLDELLGTS